LSDISNYLTTNNSIYRIKAVLLHHETTTKLFRLKIKIMSTLNLTCELWISTQRNQNDEKYGDNENQCICCKKPIKNIEKSNWIHMNEAGLVLNNLISESNCNELTGSNTMGCFPVGNDCSKKFTKDFLFKY